MRYRVNEIRLTAEEAADREHLHRILEQKLERAVRRAGGRNARISEIEILKESIDARKKPDVKAVYALAFDCDRKLDLPAAQRQGYLPPAKVSGYTGQRPVIAGFGPCGIFAALILAQAGLRPLVLERGKPVDRRMEDVQRFWREGVLDPESNVQFGEGGAGTFSDGKLTTGIRDPRIRFVLETFVQAGADPAILYRQRPHIGTDRLREIIPRIRGMITEAGGEIRFETRLEGLELERAETGEDRLRGIYVSGGERIPAEHLILAVGHSARDTFEMLKETGMPMEQKPFSIGVRIEHPQELIDEAQYGDPALAGIFGPASYQLHYRCRDGRGVYTFCMCPGGRVINAASEEGGAVTNGMSESARDSGTANSGLLVDVRTEDFGSDDPLAGVALQRKYERLAAMRGKSFPEGLPRTEYSRYSEDEQDPVRACLPDFANRSILEAMPELGKKLKGFDSGEAVMTAVETRSSSPVRILRNQQMQSRTGGVFPAGEGPGYAGGIMSAAVDGIRAAEQVISLCGGEKESEYGKCSDK